MARNHEPRELGTELRPPAASPNLGLPFKPYRWRGVPGPVIGAPGTIAQRELAEEGGE